MLIALLVVVAHIGFGFAIGSWWALLLPFALAVLAIPAGFPPSDEREPLPICIVQAWLATPEALLMIPGVLARRFARTNSEPAQARLEGRRPGHALGRCPGYRVRHERPEVTANG